MANSPDDHEDSMLMDLSITNILETLCASKSAEKQSEPNEMGFVTCLS